jgi:hypothetical protein
MTTTLDIPALERLAEPVGWVLVRDEDVLLIQPRDDLGDMDAFDEAVCEAGLTRFLRPRASTDLPSDAPPDAHTPLILVTQFTPLVRIRVPIDYHPFASLN